MVTRTVAAVFDRYEDAAEAVRRLEAAGVAHADISIVSNDSAQRDRYSTASGTTNGDRTETGAGTGATLGTVLGGGAGLLAGLGSLAIPGVGPIVAAGWLVATLTGAGVGAAAGGLAGSLTGAGVSEADAQSYQEHVNQGGTLVTARVDDAQAAQVEQMMTVGGGMGADNAMNRPLSYAAPASMMGDTTGTGTLGTAGLGAASPETTAQRDIDTGVTR